MIHMNPFQSWAMILLLVVLVFGLVYLLRAFEQRRIERARQAANDADGPLAVVTELRPVKPVRHLVLVPDLPRQTSLALYDWEKQGL